MSDSIDPLLSIIIPAANSEKTILRALRSTKTGNISVDRVVEVLVIVNNSTDQTKNLVQQYKLTEDSRVRIFSSDPGRSLARNIGISKARGKIGLFLDSDDELMCEYIEAVVRQSDTVVSKHIPVYCRALHVFDRMGGKTQAIRLPGVEYIAVHNPFVIETVAFAFQDIHYLFDENLSFCEDWKFWATNFMNRSFQRLDLLGVKVHVTGNNSMGSVRELLKADAIVRASLYRLNNKLYLVSDLKRIVCFYESTPTDEEIQFMNDSFGFLAKAYAYSKKFLIVQIVARKLFEKKIRNNIYASNDR